MIKNDRWIKSKCMPPLATVNYLLEGDYCASAPIYGDPFTDLDEEVKKHLEKAGAISGTAIVTLTSDHVVENFKPMIEPFLPMQVREINTGILVGHMLDDATGNSEPVHAKAKIISKGLTSFGYDVTLAEDAAIFSNINGTIIDPLNFVEDALIRVTAKNGYFIMPPNSYMLGYTKEYFRMPRNVIAIALGKSTYARAGAIVNVTPIEPGFEGTVVIEIANATSLPMKVYTDQGIAQFLFFESDEDCDISYADRNSGVGGKYQGQRGLQLPKG